MPRLQRLCTRSPWSRKGASDGWASGRDAQRQRLQMVFGNKGRTWTKTTRPWAPRRACRAPFQPCTHLFLAVRLLVSYCFGVCSGFDSIEFANREIQGAEAAQAMRAARPGSVDGLLSCARDNMTAAVAPRAKRRVPLSPLHYPAMVADGGGRARCLHVAAGLVRSKSNAVSSCTAGRRAARRTPTPRPKEAR